MTGRFDHDEIDGAFWRYHDNLNLAARTTDWSIWGRSLTPDATFVETQLGRIGKRESIVQRVADVMHQTGEQPWVKLNRFPVEAYAIDVHTGFVWSLWWYRFTDPGDGSVHQARAFLLLKYKADGMFRFGETIYNPFQVRAAMDSWSMAKAAWDDQADERLALLAAREREARQMVPLDLAAFDALQDR